MYSAAHYICQNMINETLYAYSNHAMVPHLYILRFYTRRLDQKLSCQLQYVTCGITQLWVSENQFCHWDLICGLRVLFYFFGVAQWIFKSGTLCRNGMDWICRQKSELAHHLRQQHNIAMRYYLKTQGKSSQGRPFPQQPDSRAKPRVCLENCKREIFENLNGCDGPLNEGGGMALLTQNCLPSLTMFHVDEDCFLKCLRQRLIDLKSCAVTQTISVHLRLRILIGGHNFHKSDVTSINLRKWEDILP